MIGSVLTVGGIVVGGMTVGNGIGVSVGNGSVGARVAISVDMGTAVFVGIRVPVGADVAESSAVTVFMCTGVEVIPGVASPGVRVGCSASTVGSTIKTP